MVGIVAGILGLVLMCYLLVRAIHESTDFSGEITLCGVVLSKLYRRQPAVVAEDIFSDQCHCGRTERVQSIGQE